MLLLAPVTIDMAGILGVDPRPYLISEVSVINFTHVCLKFRIAPKLTYNRYLLLGDFKQHRRNCNFDRLV